MGHTMLIMIWSEADWYETFFFFFARKYTSSCSDRYYFWLGVEGGGASISLYNRIPHSLRLSLITWLYFNIS